MGQKSGAEGFMSHKISDPTVCEALLGRLISETSAYRPFWRNPVPYLARWPPPRGICAFPHQGHGCLSRRPDCRRDHPLANRLLRPALLPHSRRRVVWGVLGHMRMWGILYTVLVRPLALLTGAVLVRHMLAPSTLGECVCVSLVFPQIAAMQPIVLRSGFFGHCPSIRFQNAFRRWPCAIFRKASSSSTRRPGTRWWILSRSISRRPGALHVDARACFVCILPAPHMELPRVSLHRHATALLLSPVLCDRRAQACT